MNALDNITSLKSYFLPEILLMLGSVVIVTLAYQRGKQNKAAAFYATLAFLATALAAVLLSPIPTEQGLALFQGMLAYDRMGQFFKVIIIAAAIVALILADKSADLKGTSPIEFNAFLVALTLGLCVMSVSTNLLMIYLAVEMASIVSYVMTGYITFNKRSEEAGLKYVFYGGMASGVMIFGLSLLYGFTGELDLIGIRDFLISSKPMPMIVDRTMLYVTFIFVLAGLGYKMAVAPFHMWSPDVYEGAPISVTAFLSVASKAAAFALALRFFMSGFIEPTGMPVKNLDWRLLLAVVAALTMSIGNLVALQQKNIKRFLAYSSVAHAGYMLMGIAAQNTEGVEAILFYVMVYFLMNLGAFLVAILISNQFGTESIEDYKGLAKQNGYGFFVAFCLGIFLLSLAGIPPFAGFAAKWYVFGAVIHSVPAGSSSVEPDLLWLAVIGVINSVISLFYYVRIVKYMMIDDGKAGAPVIQPSHRRFTAMLAGFAALVLIFGLAFNPLAEWAKASAHYLM